MYYDKHLRMHISSFFTNQLAPLIISIVAVFFSGIFFFLINFSFPRQLFSSFQFLMNIGTLEACSTCTEMIILKLQEDSNIGYQNKTTSYGRSFGMRNDVMQQQQQQQVWLYRIILRIGTVLLNSIKSSVKT